MSGMEIPAFISALSAATGTAGGLLAEKPKQGNAPQASAGSLPNLQLKSLPPQQDMAELFRMIDQQERMKREALASARASNTMGTIPQRGR